MRAARISNWLVLMHHRFRCGLIAKIAENSELIRLASTSSKQQDERAVSGLAAPYRSPWSASAAQLGLRLPKLRSAAVTLCARAEKSCGAQWRKLSSAIASGSTKRPVAGVLPPGTKVFVEIEGAGYPVHVYFLPWRLPPPQTPPAYRTIPSQVPARRFRTARLCLRECFLHWQSKHQR